MGPRFLSSYSTRYFKCTSKLGFIYAVGPTYYQIWKCSFFHAFWELSNLGCTQFDFQVASQASRAFGWNSTDHICLQMHIHTRSYVSLYKLMRMCTHIHSLCVRVYMYSCKYVSQTVRCGGFPQKKVGRGCSEGSAEGPDVWLLLYNTT